MKKSELKRRAKSLYKELGLTLTQANYLFYAKSLHCNGIPFEVSLKDKDTSDC